MKFNLSKLRTNIDITWNDLLALKACSGHLILIAVFSLAVAAKCIAVLPAAPIAKVRDTMSLLADAGVEVFNAANSLQGIEVADERNQSEEEVEQFHDWWVIGGSMELVTEPREDLCWEPT